MRKPRSPGAKTPPIDTPPPGGRAWERVQQFALARGLPLEIEPGKKKVTTRTKRTRKSTVKRAPKKSTQGVKPVRRRTV
jgi:hypothetical protein